MKAFAREDYFLARLSVYAATESDFSGLSIMFGIVGCEARIKTLIVSSFVEGRRLMPTKFGALDFGLRAPKQV